MNDYSTCDPSLLAEVEPVVRQLSQVVPSERILLVGARCRDVLNWRFGQRPPGRSTNDTDVAVALQDWDQFAKVVETFPSIGHTGHRFLVADAPTDIVPFGGIEAPPGISRRPPGKEDLNVHGFSDAYAHADVLPMSSGLRVRIPRPEGYAVLKAHAWLDRSAGNEYKDGSDLALAVQWYAEDSDRIYAEENLWALEHHDFDLRLAAAALLGRDMRSGLSADEAAFLATRVAGADSDLLAHYFGVGSPGWPATDRDRRRVVDALFDELGGYHVQY